MSRRHTGTSREGGTADGRRSNPVWRENSQNISLPDGYKVEFRRGNLMADGDKVSLPRAAGISDSSATFWMVFWAGGRF